MTNIRKPFFITTFLLVLGGFQAANASMIVDSLGNTASGFSDGDILVSSNVGAAQDFTPSPAPFDQSYGLDLPFGDSFAQSWTHLFATIVDDILNASITIGVYDHDSAAAGSQLALFDIDGTDFTTELDADFEMAGDGMNLMYNEYTIALGAPLFAAIADGSVKITLNMMGPGLTVPLFPPGPSVPTLNNGASLIFSTLDIEYRDSTIPAVPIPAAAPLFLSAIALFGLYRRRVLRSQA